MPAFTVFTAATQIRDCIDTAHFHPGDSANTETGGDGNIETTIAIEQSWVRAIKLQTLLVSNEHRHFRAVFAGIEDLLRLVVVLIKFNLGFTVQSAHTRDHIVAVSRRRSCKAAEGIEHVGIFAAAVKACRCSDPRKLDFTHKSAVHCMQSNLRLGILQIVTDEHIAHDSDTVHRVVGLSNDLLPVLFRGLFEIDCDHTLVGGVKVSLEVQDMAIISDKGILVVKVADQLGRQTVRFGEIFDDDAITVIRSQPHCNDQIVAVF